MLEPCSINCEFHCIIAGLAIAIASASALGRAAEKRTNSQPEQNVPTVQAMIAAKTDVWGDAAMRQTNGPSYEFFKNLLPPVRWVNAAFHHYPIMLSAPLAAQKVRLISNGSAINARANNRRISSELGTPIHFFIGDSAEPYGDDVSRLETPTCAEGYLPVVTIRYV